ncbi:Heterokaryon incompatibility protein s [Lachnellula suecica]|uniref:Heterokaryon incompatibility protein s n=1 Tax=Lachnellula suecica TaxID=602035 RepID=A0A8T9C024_9HELO|nr:Heterokaryon incompatibility protein s [Lachnellula suecica]
MAEPFGIVSGAIGIASAFTACIDCFGYIHFGRQFGRDFQTNQLALNCARLRLTRWGESVNIYDDPKLGRQDATAAEIQLAKDALLQILVLFADTKSISQKYKLTATAREDLSVYSTDDMDPKIIVLDNKMRALALQRQKKTQFLKLTSWALYHRSTLKDLLEQIVLLLDEIEKIFPEPHAQVKFVQQEAAEIGKETSDKQSLQLVEDAATGIDSLLQKTVKEVIAGHQYLNITFGGKGLAGDAFSDDWKGGAIGASHKFDGVEVKEGGKGLLGNKYGGKDFFDD